MKVLRCLGNGRVALSDADKPTVAPGEAIVRVEVSAVCGSERGTFTRGATTNAGHEVAGVLESVPEDCDFRVGERVGVSAVVGCGHCIRCATGQELYCQLGPTISFGWHAGYIAVPSRALRAVPPDLDAAMAAMMTGDPLGVPVRGMRRAPTQPGDVVLVLGLGPVGLGHVLVRAYSGCNVIGVDPSAYRRDLALSVGAAAVYEPGEYKGRAALVIECSGQPSVIRESFGLAADGGVVLQSGECHVEVGIIPSEVLVRREVSYIGSWYYATEDYGMMCRLMASGLPLGRLLTHQVAAADAQAAISEFLGANTGKVALVWKT